MKKFTDKIKVNESKKFSENLKGFEKKLTEMFFNNCSPINSPVLDSYLFIYRYESMTLNKKINLKYG